MFVAYLLALAWAGRRGYVYFYTASEIDPLHEHEAILQPLDAFELVPTRVSGWFTVEGRNQYYVDVEADLETVGTREHIILGRIHASRFLLVGRWPEDQLGWWYIFFQPAMIREVQAGRLYFGSRSRPALWVHYAPDEESRQNVYFAFDSPIALWRVWDDLTRDAPPGAGA
jgi:hypothetical protein